MSYQDCFRCNFEFDVGQRLVFHPPGSIPEQLLYYPNYENRRWLDNPTPCQVLKREHLCFGCGNLDVFYGGKDPRCQCNTRIYEVATDEGKSFHALNYELKMAPFTESFSLEIT